MYMGNHITPAFRQLHWLPVQRQVEFKIACFVPIVTHWHQKRRRISVPTFDWPPSMVVVLSAHLPTGHSLFYGHAAVFAATKPLLLRDHTSGTVYLLICDR